MAKGQKPDPKRMKVRTPHATNMKVPNGGEERGYKAGELFGVIGHRTHAHQPCISTYTEGDMSCPYCSSGLIPEWRGYVPVWDRDWTLRYALISEDYFETVDVIPWKTMIRVTRAKNPISPLVIRAEPCLTRELPERSPWNEPVDMELVCLNLWKLDSLTAWVMNRRKTEPKPATKNPLRSDGKPFSPMLRAAAEKYQPPPQEEIAEQTYDAVVNRLAKKKDVLANGKHGK